jgi:tetratricopeptide (TPR) repeat protein
MSTVTAMREKLPEDKRPVLALIALKRRAGAADEVVQLYRGLTERDPKDSELKIGLAAALNRAGAHSQAQGVLDTLLERDKKARTPEALFELARAWAEREPYRARQLVKESIDSVPTAEKYDLLGQLAVARGQIDEARKAYAKAIELDPTFVDPHVALARIALEARDYDAVIDELEKVLVQVPNHREAAIKLGDVYSETGKPSEAISRYEIALSTDENEKLLMKVARLHMHRLGQLGPAIKTLRRLIALNPDIAEAHFHLGMALKDKGQRREAISSLKKCIALEPEGDWAGEAQTMLQDLQK